MKKIRTLVECAVLIALATVLSVIKIYEAPLGGSVTLFSMVPIILISFRHGIKWGLGSGFVYSVIQLLLGLKNVMYVPGAVGIILCILLDYILPFTLLGLAGISHLSPAGDIPPLAREGKNKFIFPSLAKGWGTVRRRWGDSVLRVFFVCILRYLCHVLSGAVVWYELTKAGGWNDLVMQTGMWMYSIIYNTSYMLPETVITLIGTPIILKLTFIKKFRLDK
ncbi:MAG: energy-coupled thiamine transporter ThiT [Oscillospiraceae bacterium]|nr:energy-coupled thiamine transporter ThiT [Oscillospiraceae bacterium]